MGITRLGAVAVALNSWWSREELAYGIADSSLRVIIVDAERLGRLPESRGSLKVIAVRTDAAEDADAVGWEKFLALGAAAHEPVPVSPEAAATLLYTSGSTAHPKGVLSSHRAIIHALLGWESAAALGAAMMGEDAPAAPSQQLALILSVPLFHVTGLNVHFLSSFRQGRKLVGMYKWDAEEALAIIERERITHFNGVPTMAWELVQSPNYDAYDLSSLIAMGGGGAPMVPEQTRQIDRRSVIPGTGYGMTETNGLGTGISGANLVARPQSCGPPLALVVDIKVVDAAGEELPRNQTGEIWIRGPMNFSGYWNRPEDTAKALTDGWVHTGDIGYMDEEDFVFITDRAKDMVIRGGENIGCQEVEAAIYELPGVLECAVFGVPDERLGEAGGGGGGCQARRHPNAGGGAGRSGLSPSQVQGAGACLDQGRATAQNCFRQDIQARPAGRGHQSTGAVLALVGAGQLQHMLRDVVQDHLLGDGGDAHQPRFAPVALHMVLLGVAEAAVGLHGLVGGLKGGIRRQPFGHVRLRAAGLALVQQPAGLADHQLRGVQPNPRFAEGKRNALVLADGPVEHHPLVGVAHRPPKRRPPDAEGFRSY